MKSLGLALGLLCMGLAVCPAQAESNGGVRVMPLGDSITDGVDVPGGYRIKLWQLMVAGGYTVDFVGSRSNGPAELFDHDHEGHPAGGSTNWMRMSSAGCKTRTLAQSCWKSARTT